MKLQRLLLFITSQSKKTTLYSIFIIPKFWSPKEILLPSHDYFKTTLGLHYYQRQLAYIITKIIQPETMILGRYCHHCRYSRGKESH